MGRVEGGRRKGREPRPPEVLLRAAASGARRRVDWPGSLGGRGRQTCIPPKGRLTGLTFLGGRGGRGAFKVVGVGISFFYYSRFTSVFFSFISFYVLIVIVIFIDGTSVSVN